METFVYVIETKKNDPLHLYLKEQGFELSRPPYTLFSGKKSGISVTLFESQKCVIQGKQSKEFIEFFFEPEILESFPVTHAKALIPAAPSNFMPHIGVDESGKGDFFGPLVIAGVYADHAGLQKLQEIGVKDSKTLTDKSMQLMAQKIKKCCAFQIVIINPLKYNEIYDGFKNLNALLAWGHATVLESLVIQTGCRTATIDQFANEKVVIQALKRKKVDIELTQRHKGEEDPIVAAASILARDGFVQRLAALSEEAGIILPKGASAAVIKAGKRLVLEKGHSALPYFAKMHFKTLDSVIKTS